MRLWRRTGAYRATLALVAVVVVIAGIVIATRRSGRGEIASTARLAEAPSAGCHVTHPNGSKAPGEAPSDTSHGKRGLWTQLPLDGVLRITATTPVPPGETFGTMSPDGSLNTKFPWWGSRSAAAKLTIRGTRLDGQARRLRLTGGSGPTANSPHFWPTRLRFSTPGCWRVTAKSGRARLTFTISVHSAND